MLRPTGFSRDLEMQCLPLLAAHTRCDRMSCIKVVVTRESGSLRKAPGSE